MRLVRVAVRTVGELCITAGVVLLLFVVWQLWWTDLTSGRAQQSTARTLEQRWAAIPPTSGSQPPGRTPGSTDGAEKASAPPRQGEAFALIRVPRFGKDYVRPVLEGTELSVLEEGVGHYSGSAGPGAVGNFALAGHRVTYAKPFGEIATLRAGDPVVIETAATWYVYRVVRHVVVSPEQVDVVAPVPQRPGVRPTERLLTLTACHPRYSARQRYVVFARLAKEAPRAGSSLPDVLAAAG